MRKPSAIVIDDDKGLSQALATVLDIVGFETEVINDSRIALQRIGEGLPDLITLDIQMPVISGSEILRGIRADERLRHTKVILITANARPSATQELEEMADIILTKPITLSQISQFAARLVHRN